MYADSWIDLVILDISNPTNVEEIKRIGGVFPNTGPTFLFMEDPDVEVYFEEIDDYRGIVVDWELIYTEEYYEGGGGCFSAGTEVLTASGPRAIEKVGPGTEVYSFDISSGEWTLVKVLKQYELDIKGDLVTIQMDSTEVEVTESHPFYVLHGEGLASRPQIKYIQEGEYKLVGSGRWVEARDLKKGDVLWSKRDGEKIITGIRTGDESNKVYNLEVGGNHNFAIHESGILVHNKRGGDASMELPPSSTGKGGSLARFTIVDDYLYVLSGSDLQLFKIKEPTAPTVWKSVKIGWDIETIFPYEDKLFIGGQEGMYIYDNNNPANPVQLSRFSHVTSCDPVVVEGSYAYVTLRGGTRCGGWNNRLEIIDISNIYGPKLIADYPMDGPYGLGIDQGLLFICDGGAGLKLFNATDPFSLELIGHFPEIKTHDVILHRKVALLVGRENLYQYDYDDAGNIVLLSMIEKSMIENQRNNMVRFLEAVHNGNSEIVKALLEDGVSVDSKDPYGSTPLMIAARSGDVKVVKVLLYAEAEVNSQDDNGNTALMLASEKGHSEVVELLVAAGAGVNDENIYGWTPLMFASQKGHAAVVRQLIKAGADVQVRDKSGWNALLYATSGNHVEVINELEEAGASVNWSALLSDKNANPAVMVNVLLEADVDLEARDNHGMTALIWAAWNNHIGLVQILIEVGADVNRMDNSGWTALMRASRHGYTDVVNILLMASADVDMRHERGWTALMWAAKYGHTEIVDMLLKAGADVNLINNGDKSALMLARENNNTSVVQLFIEAGAE